MAKRQIEHTSASTALVSVISAYGQGRSWEQQQWLVGTAARSMRLRYGFNKGSCLVIAFTTSTDVGHWQHYNDTVGFLGVSSTGSNTAPCTTKQQEKKDLE